MQAVMNFYLTMSGRTVDDDFTESKLPKLFCPLIFQFSELFKNIFQNIL